MSMSRTSIWQVRRNDQSTDARYSCSCERSVCPLRRWKVVGPQSIVCAPPLLIVLAMAARALLVSRGYTRRE